jgi:hypothetical protein
MRPKSPEGIRYALYLSCVLMGLLTMEPISEQIPDQIPLGKPQRLDREAYESPALPLSYSAVVEILAKAREGLPGREIPGSVPVHGPHIQHTSWAATIANLECP